MNGTIRSLGAGSRSLSGLSIVSDDSARNTPARRTRTMQVATQLAPAQVTFFTPNGNAPPAKFTGGAKFRAIGEDRKTPSGPAAPSDSSELRVIKSGYRGGEFVGPRQPPPADLAPLPEAPPSGGYGKLIAASAGVAGVAAFVWWMVRRARRGVVGSRLVVA